MVEDRCVKCVIDRCTAGEAIQRGKICDEMNCVLSFMVEW